MFKVRNEILEGDLPWNGHEIQSFLQYGEFRSCEIPRAHGGVYFKGQMLFLNDWGSGSALGVSEISDIQQTSQLPLMFPFDLLEVPIEKVIQEVVQFAPSRNMTDLLLQTFKLSIYPDFHSIFGELEIFERSFQEYRLEFLHLALRVVAQNLQRTADRLRVNFLIQTPMEECDLVGEARKFRQVLLICSRTRQIDL